MPILIKRREALDEGTRQTIMEKRPEIVGNLLEFMSYCYTARTGSKYSLMGPVGKLLSLLNTTKLPDWEKTKGYITNVVRMNQNWIHPNALEILDQAVNAFQEVREQLNEMEWLNFISGVDYEVFFQLFKTGVDRAAEKTRNTFQKFLLDKYESLEGINKALNTHFQTKDDIDLDTVSEEVQGVKEIMNEFWEKYKANRKQKKNQEKMKEDIEE